MILFFDVLKLETEANGNDTLFISILEDYYYTQKYKQLQKIKYKSIKGLSWLINPVPLFDRKIADLAYIVQYIKLAGRRNYHYYKLYNVLTLDISFYPNLNVKLLENNPLLTIINNKIHFKFEDIIRDKFNKDK